MRYQLEKSSLIAQALAGEDAPHDFDVFLGPVRRLVHLDAVVGLDLQAATRPNPQQSEPSLRRLVQGNDGHGQVRRGPRVDGDDIGPQLDGLCYTRYLGKTDETVPDRGLSQ